VDNLSLDKRDSDCSILKFQHLHRMKLSTCAYELNCIQSAETMWIKAGNLAIQSFAGC